MLDRFDEVIVTRERLRQLSRQPTTRAKAKVIDHIDDICRRFIAACPFVLVATRGVDGHMEISPKGDPAGFVAVLDDKTLAIPDRPGNNRLDTFENVLASPAVGLLFLIPGKGETLRVSGKGSVVRDKALQTHLSVVGKPAQLVLVVKVEEAFMHCSKCIIRSSLWLPASWPDPAGLPTLANAIVAHARPTETLAEMEDFIRRHDEHLY